MGGSCLLDTNAASGVLRNVVAVEEILAEYDAIYVPVVVLGELYFGAHKAVNPDRQLQRIAELEAGVSILYPDVETAQLFGKIRATLSQSGQMIPINDLWIAAIALQHELPVVTQDKHFDRVEGLPVVAW